VGGQEVAAEAAVMPLDNGSSGAARSITTKLQDLLQGLLQAISLVMDYKACYKACNGSQVL
jgi:hypothetical protein